ncbi:MAG: hypothetical protein G01um101417_342 [Parcubacteria group bacterium Gr01-1014_17]|nr:MAG: hypothetical protein G01um101417_342 [Parcubacteria group bacterium Gr01-1014_17]
MKNPFCISRRGLQHLFLSFKGDFAQDLFQRALDRYSYEEIEVQLNNGKGVIIDAIAANSKLSSSKTENVEVLTALQLSDFYFPYNETAICFELRSDVSPFAIKSYQDLTSALEDNTYVDCSVIYGDKKMSFQIKRYPQKHLEHKNEAFMKWFESKRRHYGEMNGTILVIILQPSGFSMSSKLNLTELAREFIFLKDEITFDEIVVFFNDSMKYFTLYKLYPKEEKLLIPLEWGLKRFRGEI